MHEDAEFPTEKKNGKYTFSDAMRENRDLMIETAISNTLQVVNTMYRKPPGKTATYRKNKETDIQFEPANRNTHEQLDYILTPKRWRNTVINAESDTTANIHSDHYPVIITNKSTSEEQKEKEKEERDMKDVKRCKRLQ